MAKDGREPKRESEQCCYNCGKPAHLAHDCDHADEQKCHSCGEFEHSHKDCTEVKYYTFGETGHGHVTVNRRKASEINYYCCGESRHLVEKCAIEALA